MRESKKALSNFHRSTLFGFYLADSSQTVVLDVLLGVLLLRVLQMLNESGSGFFR
jgi:hypothetical protein